MHTYTHPTPCSQVPRGDIITITLCLPEDVFERSDTVRRLVWTGDFQQALFQVRPHHSPYVTTKRIHGHPDAAGLLP